MMWSGEPTLLARYPKAIGIAGDSLTFLGGLLLSAEALWKKTEREAIAVKETTVKYFPQAEDQAGRPVSPSEVEKQWFRRWDAASKAGVLLMALGFLFLLISRIFAE